jgi:DNA-binding GntR family transcriptional regulator
VTRFSTVQEAITRELRDAIVARQLPPGTRLVVEELAAQFEMSRLPIRKTLWQLSADGLVVTQSYRGAAVVALSIVEIREIFLMRRLLEGEAARPGTRRTGPDERTRLRTLMNEVRDAVRDHGRWTGADRAFHMTVYQSSGFPRLVRLVGQLRRHIERYVRLHIALEANIPLSMRRHQEIVVPCLAGDGQATILHLDEAAQMFIAELERTGAHSSGPLLELATVVRRPRCLVVPRHGRDGRGHVADRGSADVWHVAASDLYVAATHAGGRDRGVALAADSGETDQPFWIQTDHLVW